MYLCITVPLPAAAGGGSEREGSFFCFLSFLGGVGGGRLTCFAGSLAAKTLYAIEGGGGNKTPRSRAPPNNVEH